MDTLSDILHNMHEHTETYRRLLTEPSIDPAFRQRLEAHIVLEEQENSQRLEAMERTGLTKKMLDHSFFLQRMIEQPAMAASLKAELLHHFAEEHAAWQEDLKRNAGWTVGPMWRGERWSASVE
ncbi:MAG: hypothetical protein AB1758_18710 [Candidatus Eremiobacterota bacterium]